MADRRTVKERVAEAPKDNGGAAQQRSSEEDAAAVGSDQERRANFAKTVAAAFRDVSLKRLKANRQRAIVSASACIIAAAEVSFGQAPKSDLVKLQEEVARLTAALESLLKENKSLRAELRKMREQEAERSGTTPQQPQSFPVERQVLPCFATGDGGLPGALLCPGRQGSGANSGTGSVGTCGGETPSEADSVCGSYLSCH
ncbi:hypothetical protein B5X24_HaOG211848 [Helicoverpa armigera]|nr:hypothetical protein B5X24_HaOG211848 [Helicoverpa armigera]